MEKEDRKKGRNTLQISNVERGDGEKRCVGPTFNQHMGAVFSVFMVQISKAERGEAAKR